MSEPRNYRNFIAGSVSRDKIQRQAAIAFFILPFGIGLIIGMWLGAFISLISRQ